MKHEMAPSCPSSAVLRGLTLIELLVAMAIAVLLVGVVFLIYGTALNTIRAQKVWRENLEPAEDVLDMIQRDILCSLAPRGITNPPFVLRPADEGRPDTLSLRLFTAWPGEGSNDWRAYAVHEVEYSLRAQSATGPYALIRQCRPFRTADSTSAPVLGTPPRLGRGKPCPRRGKLACLAGMEILVYDGSAWTNAWATASGIPQAARIMLQLELPSGPRTITAETLIPAGHRIKAPTQTD